MTCLCVNVAFAGTATCVDDTDGAILSAVVKAKPRRAAVRIMYEHPVAVRRHCRVIACGALLNRGHVATAQRNAAYSGRSVYWVQMSTCVDPSTVLAGLRTRAGDQSPLRSVRLTGIGLDARMSGWLQVACWHWTLPVEQWRLGKGACEAICHDACWPRQLAVTLPCLLSSLRKSDSPGQQLYEPRAQN